MILGLRRLGIRLSALALFMSVTVFASPILAQTAEEEDEEESPAATTQPANPAPAAQVAAPTALPESSATTSAMQRLRSQDSAEAAEEEEEDLEVSEKASSLDFLLPMDGDIFYTGDVQILVNVMGMEPTGLVLVLDGYNYDQPLTLEAGLIRTSLKGMHNGAHDLKLLLLDGQNRILAQGLVRFFVRVPEPKKVEHTGPVRQFGRVAGRADLKGAEARNRVKSISKLSFNDNGDLVAGKAEKPLAQQVDGAVEAAYNLKVYDWETHAKVLLRTDEDEYRQPSHRFSARVKYGQHGYVRGGDVYPAFNDLLLNGARLRGGEAGLAIIAKDINWASLKVARGESRREIPAHIAVYDTGKGFRSDTVSGDFGQTLSAVRLGFGGGPTFNLGFTGMMAEDRVGSQNNLDIADTLHGTRPLQNAGAGIDLRIGLWDGRIQIFHDAAFTLLTRDKSLGPTDGEKIDLDFNPMDYDDLFVVNPTTDGLEYLLANSQNELDVAGFVDANSAWDVGISASIPLSGMVTESEVRYDHMGLLYHTEGNPFLGNDPGNGIRFLQKLLLFDNRLSLGLEAGAFNQDMGFSEQQERSYKAEIRWTPAVGQPSGWLSVGSTERAPKGDYPYQYHSGYSTLNLGGFQQFILPIGKLHTSTLYGFTHSDFELTATPIQDTLLGSIDSLINFPATNTHIANISFQLRPRAIDFMPRIAYTFAYNGVQEPTHNVAMGFQQLLLAGRVKGDVSLQIGQYPESIDKNDIMAGETFTLDVRITATQTARFVEKWIQYGERKNVSVGGFYELYF